MTMNSDKREKTINNVTILFRLSAFRVHSFVRYLCVAVASLCVGGITFISAPAFAGTEQTESTPDNKIHPLQLSASESLSTAGYFQLTWEFPDSGNGNTDATTFVLQQSIDDTFANATEWQISRDMSFSMSGLESGHYFYRVGTYSKPRAWSNLVEVQVAHHGLFKAFGLFSLGAVIFIALISVILINRHQNNSQQNFQQSSQSSRG